MSVFMMAVVRRVVIDDSVRLPYGGGTPMSKGQLRRDQREVREVAAFVSENLSAVIQPGAARVV